MSKILTSEVNFFLRKKDAANKLGISPRTLDEWVKKDPDFPRPIKKGVTRQAIVLFSNKELDEYMSKNDN